MDRPHRPNRFQKNHHRGDDHRGGDHRGGDHRGGDHRGGHHRGGDHRGGDHRGRSSGPKPVSIAVQEPFLNTVRKEHVAVTLVLNNGTERQAIIDSFDQNSILVYSPDDSGKSSDERGLELIYKHAVAEVKPQREIVRTYSGIALIDKVQQGDGEDYDEDYESEGNWKET